MVGWLVDWMADCLLACGRACLLACGRACLVTKFFDWIGLLVCVCWLAGSLVGGCAWFVRLLV